MFEVFVDSWSEELPAFLISGKMFTVYDVITNSAGYPMFLIYCNNAWHWVSAKYFKPII